MGLSRNENIIENILGASNTLGPAQSENEAILLAILNGETYSLEGTSRIARLLIAICNGTEWNDPLPTRSRNEAILYSILNGEEYTGYYNENSRMEKLLVQWSTEAAGVETTVGPAAVVSIADALEKAAIAVLADIEAVQSGSGNPTPDNIRPITGWSECTITRNDGTEGSQEVEYTIDLDGTIYGGSLNVTTGVLIVDSYYFEGTAISSVSIQSSTDEYVWARINLSANSLPGATASTAISNRFSQNLSVGPGRMVLTSVYLNLWIDATELTDATAESVITWLHENECQFVYELAEPTTVQLTATAVQMLAGNNTLWADTGDITVTYKAES